MSKLSITICTIIFACILLVASCTDKRIETAATYSFPELLSKYGIYEGAPSLLRFNNNYFPYEIPTPLFSDYTRKQRLIMVPRGSRIEPKDDGLPVFPDSTIIVKTFYVYNDARDTLSQKKILETRVLVKMDNKWNAATYLWNSGQTDALLTKTGIDVPLNWINEYGNPIVISYHVPSQVECGMCHRSDHELIPLGPKMRNLNRDVKIDNRSVNQLLCMQDAGLMTKKDPALFAATTDWTDTSFTLEARARSYLDINCAHCHNDKGLAKGSSLRLGFEIPIGESKIFKKKTAIVDQMSRGSMPLIGTSVIHAEGLDLIKQFINSLH